MTKKMTTEVILDKVYEEWLFQVIAKKIASFSTKLRRAMLIDLARFMDFEAEPSPLQVAFLKVGIDLEEYAELFPQEPILRTRHSSLVSLGYRQLRMLFRNCYYLRFCNSSPWSVRRRSRESDVYAKIIVVPSL